MEESLLAGKYLDEGTELEDGNNLSVVNLTLLRHCAYAHDPVICLCHCFSVVGGDVHDTLAVNLVDGYAGAGLGLYLLDGLATLADDSSDELLRNLELLDSRYERLVVLAWLADGLHHLAHDVQTALTCLLESLLKHFV